jgi:predicted amidohydrolase
MGNSIGIGLWSYDSTSTINLQKSVSERCGELEKAVTKFATFVKHLKDASERSLFKGIFLAPEYFFCAQAADGMRRPMDDWRHYALEARLLQMSKNFAQILIVPGTIFYARDIVREIPISRGFCKDKSSDDFGTRSVAKQKIGDGRERMLKRTDAAMTAPLNWGVKKEAMDIINNQGIVTNAGRIPSLTSVREAIAKKNPKVARNVTYLLLGGKRYARYDKQTDALETNSAAPEDLVFIPGTRDQCPEIGEYRFGTEICNDHFNSMLFKRQPANLHFHLLVSDFVNNKEGAMAMCKGGYFLHAATVRSETQVFHRDQGSQASYVSSDGKSRPTTGPPGTGALKRVKVDHFSESGGAIIKVYAVDLPPKV